MKGITRDFLSQLLCRGEVIPLELTKEEQDIVRKKFCSYCIKVLEGEAHYYLRELRRQQKREVCFSELLQEELDQLFTPEEQPELNYFHVLGLDVPVKDDDISDALNCLPERRRMIILMTYYLDMTEKEIAECLQLVQSTVHYHKAQSLRLLKEILE